MSRQTTLADALTLVKQLIGQSSSGTSVDATLYGLIEAKQKLLAAAYEWPFLKDRWDVSVGAGERTKDLPTTDKMGNAATINTEHKIAVRVAFNNSWLPVNYGIDEEEEFNTWDSDAGEKMDPIEKWQCYGQSDFEVWPIPAATQTLRFVGQRNLATLRDAGAFDPDATLDLDDILVCHFVAYERLKRHDQKDAEEKLGVARERLASLRGTGPQREIRITLNRPGISMRLIRRVPLLLFARPQEVPRSITIDQTNISIDHG